MPPIPRRDYSLPQPAGFQFGTDGVRVPFPAIRRVATAVITVLSRWPRRRDLTPVGAAPQPLPAGYPKPIWPKDHTATILDKLGVFRADS